MSADATVPPILDRSLIQIGLPSESPEAAIRRCGESLVAGGYVEPAYIDSMLARQAKFSVAIGNAIAIPHGEAEGKAAIRRTGLTVSTYPDGIDWHGVDVRLVIGIAARGEEHLEFLARIADAFDEEDKVRQAVAAGQADLFHRLLDL
ncbi:MAG: PTS sugar transporter subunit IIA [Propionibacteriaceae bacterium]|jgi:mannitol/fructose-specific phosphotransferase system IIA component|nr:PTS sugar transporter subunit IIA [Propionibacteriaceae bacterium]